MKHRDYSSSVVLEDGTVKLDYKRYEHLQAPLLAEHIKGYGKSLCFALSLIPFVYLPVSYMDPKIFVHQGLYHTGWRDASSKDDEF